jgi:hypothetical protein
VSQETKINRLSALCSRLNSERYSAGIGSSRRHFTPCAKSLCYLAAMLPPGACLPPALDDLAIDSTTPMTLVRQRAAMTICECHPIATADDLLRWEYGDPPANNGP